MTCFFFVYSYKRNSKYYIWKCLDMSMLYEHTYFFFQNRLEPVIHFIYNILPTSIYAKNNKSFVGQDFSEYYVNKLYTLTLGGLLIVLASIILEAWKLDNEPMENQLEELDTPDFWLTFDRPDVTDRPDSEDIEDKAVKNIWTKVTLCDQM